MRDIDNYMTPTEAAYRWNKSQDTLRNKLKPSVTPQREIDEMIERGLIKSFKKPGGTRKEWIIARQAMEIWFGEEIVNKE